MAALKSTPCVVTTIIFAFLLISSSGLSANNGKGNGFGPDNNKGNAYSHNNKSDEGNDDSDNETPSEPVQLHQATLAWKSPTTRTDSSCLNGEIAGYELNYRSENSGENHVSTHLLSTGALSCSQVDYEDACGDIVSNCSYTLSDLDSDTWYFSISTIDIDNVIGPATETITATLQ